PITLAFLFCNDCVPPWEIKQVQLDKPPWLVEGWKAGDRFRCPGCGSRVEWHIHRSGVAAWPTEGLRAELTGHYRRRERSNQRASDEVLQESRGPCRSRCACRCQNFRHTKY